MEEDIKSKRRQIIFAITVLLIIHIILTLIKIPSTSTETYVEQVPYEVVETYAILEEVEVQDCMDKEYDYSVRWKDWQPEKGDYISPTLTLTNKEPIDGTFRVYFAFFDSNEYEKFIGKNYDSIKDILPWEYADMNSESVVVDIKAKEEKEIVIYTKRNKQVTYWVYANINAPSYYFCEPKTIVKDVLKNNTVTKYRKETKERNRTKYISLWRFIIDGLS